MELWNYANTLMKCFPLRDGDTSSLTSECVYCVLCVGYFPWLVPARCPWTVGGMSPVVSSAASSVLLPELQHKYQERAFSYDPDFSRQHGLKTTTLLYWTSLIWGREREKERRGEEKRERAHVHILTTFAPSFPLFDFMICRL